MSGEAGTRLRPLVRNPRPLEAGVDIGHVHLRAGYLETVRAFYVDILGFDVVMDVPEALFVSAGGYHHHLGFNTWQSAGGSPPPAGSTGLYHVAIRYPTRDGLADAVRRLHEAGWPIDHGTDHGTHLAVYLADGEDNGLELYWDRPEAEWPLDAAGHLAGVSQRYDPVQGAALAPASPGCRTLDARRRCMVPSPPTWNRFQIMPRWSWSATSRSPCATARCCARTSGGRPARAAIRRSCSAARTTSRTASSPPTSTGSSRCARSAPATCSCSRTAAAATRPTASSCPSSTRSATARTRSRGSPTSPGATGA